MTERSITSMATNDINSRFLSERRITKEKLNKSYTNLTGMSMVSKNLLMMQDQTRMPRLSASIDLSNRLRHVSVEMHRHRISMKDLSRAEDSIAKTEPELLLLAKKKTQARARSQRDELIRLASING